MASLISLSLLSLLLFFSLSSASHHHRDNRNRQKPDSTQPLIIQACKSTRNPTFCETSLVQSGHLPPNPTPLQIIQSSLSISAVNLDTATSMVRSIKDSSVGNQNRTTAAINCLEALRNSRYRLNLTDEALPRGRIKDARAWASASLLFQYDCWSGLKYANDTDQVNQTMSFMNNTLIVSTSNALSMMTSYDMFGNVTGSWKPPGTERTGMWDVSGPGGQTGLGFNGGVPSLLKEDVTVCKEGGCNYKTVQEAVDVAPDHLTVKKFVIRIKEGVYEETVRIPLEKTNVVFMGDGMGKTVITGSLNVGMPGMSTTNTATVGVTGDGFMAYGITFQNTAGPDAHQAVAFRSDSDLSILENCEFIGNQDTLYAHSLRQFYKSCHIQGNVDFIFGNSASVFQDCTILISPRQTNPEKGENNAVTAHGRTDPAQTTGFVFQNCLINGTDAYISYYFAKPKVHKNYLGRPWKEFSRTVLIHCNLEALVSPQGWMPWSGDFALETLYYGEFENSGPGSDTSQRVAWSSQIPSEHVFGYSVASFIQGDQWIPTSN